MRIGYDGFAVTVVLHVVEVLSWLFIRFYILSEEDARIKRERVIILIKREKTRSYSAVHCSSDAEN